MGAVGRGGDGQRGAVVDYEGVKGGVGRNYAFGQAGGDMEFDNVLFLEQSSVHSRIADIIGAIVAIGINGLVGVDVHIYTTQTTAPSTGGIADA